MKIQTQLARFTLSLAVAAGSLAVIGCGADDGLDKRYPVSGKVTYKGAPVEKGSISFVPEKEGRGATGVIENGSYSLTTQSPGDGAFPGSYKVTVDTRVLDEAAMKAAAKKFAEKMGYKGEVTQIPENIRSQFTRDAKGKTPDKYLKAETSDAKVTVEAKSNSIDVDLKD